MEPKANIERNASFAANSDAAYCGYDMGMYMKIHCIVIKPDPP